MEEFLKLFNTTDILWHLFNTAILFAAIRLLVYKPVRKFMDARTQRIRAAFDDAAAKQAQAESLMAEAKDARSAAEAEAARVQAEGAAQAEAAAIALLDEAKKQAAAIVAQAGADAAAETEAARVVSGRQALAMAVDIAEKMIGRELSQKDNELLAREFLTKVV